MCHTLQPEMCHLNDMFTADLARREILTCSLSLPFLSQGEADPLCHGPLPGDYITMVTGI